jgi:Recombination directionality factor-like
MGILGLTHDENGGALGKLPVTIKVAIGEGPEPGSENSRPRRLDHFVFKRKTLRGEEVVWERAADISKAHGEKPTELGVTFLHDDPGEVFRTEYAWWTPVDCKCRGELVQIASGGALRYEMQATRRTQEHPEGQVWPGNRRYTDGPKKGQPVEPCGGGCPDLKRGDCRPSGDLYFILEKFPTFGSVCRLHTSSYRSIRNLSNALMRIRGLNGGRLSGIKATLRVSPERISYSGREGRSQTSIIFVLTLEMGGTDLHTLVANRGEPAKRSDSGLIVDLSGGVQHVVREAEAGRAREIAGEFYSKSQSVAEGTGVPGHEQTAGADRLARICELARRLGLNRPKTRTLIAQSRGDVAGLERKLLDELHEQSSSPAGDGENL